MDSFSLRRYNSPKPYLKLSLDVSGKIISWTLPDSAPIKKKVKRLAIEINGCKGKKQKSEESKAVVVQTQDSTKDSTLDRSTSLVEKCNITITYFSKRKIIFKLIKTKLEADEIVMLIPSWGLRTENRIWVLIPV